MTNHNEHHGATPSDLWPIEAALNELAQHERAAAPADFESRLSALIPGRRLRLAGEMPIVRTRRISLAGLRIAAAILLMGALATIIIVLRTPPAPTPAPANGTLYAMSGGDLEDEVDMWLSLRTPDEFQNLADRIDLLAVDTDSLSSPFSRDVTGLLDPGAM